METTAVNLKLQDWNLRETFFSSHRRAKEFEKIVNNLDGTEDGEAGEKSESASKNWDLSLKGCLLVLVDLVKQGRVEVDLDQDQPWVSVVFHWNGKMN